MIVFRIIFSGGACEIRLSISVSYVSRDWYRRYDRFGLKFLTFCLS